MLVGTRALLGEGWDARAVTGVVDLTSATTSTAVVQTRGRALRTDPGWPDKVALTWTVVCLSDTHPKGDQDWQRFVRKHEHYLGLDADGEVFSGVAHVGATLSPYAPPPVAAFDAVNAAMLRRAERRDRIREAWAVGTPYEDRFVRTVRIVPRRSLPVHNLPAPIAWHDRALQVRDGRPARWRPHPLAALGVTVAVLALVLGAGPALGAGLGLLVAIGVQLGVAVRRGGALAADLAQLDEAGEYRCALNRVDAEVSARFADALDEVVSPIASPRYVVPRWVRSGPVGRGDAWLTALGLLRPDGEVWHSVPVVLGRTGKLAQIFARHFDHWVGGGAALYTGSPEGEGVMVTHRGSDPFDVTTVPRTRWR